MQLPFVSLVIATYNRGHILCALVSHLLKQEYPRHEIVVVDQTEVVPECVEEFFEHLGDGRVRYIHISQVGLPNARNVGIQAAKGEIVLFVDDDAVPCDQHLIRHHAQNYCAPSIVGVAGRVRDPRHPEESDPSKILKLTAFGTVSGGRNGIVRTTVDVLSGCNMSFRKRDAIEAGLFDMRCIIGSAEYEDVDFSLRLRHNGLFMFDPRAAVSHYAASSGGCGSRAISALKRHVWRSHNMAVVCLRNRDIISPFLFIVGRIGAMLRFALRSRSLRPLGWLSYALFFGYRTYADGEASIEVIDWINRSLR